VGSFQAVKHLLAGAHLAVEFARPVVYRAAWSLARDEPTRGRDASMAKAMASEAATVAARAALQVHGAIGYTEEHELHRWLKRAFALAGAWGDASRHRERVKDALLGAP
jgi:alkylation response protein AidB-like acyl-CoA dehydrogenase